MSARPAGTGDGLPGTSSGLVAIEPAVRYYDWGSPDAIPSLLGIEPDGRPVAELWFGAHPDGPALVATSGQTLTDVVGADPTGTLGRPSVARFGPQLPFLLKVLAAERPLSLQVHPSLRQARAGRARERELGVPASAATANYRDDNHKPELICALSDFWALSGFRPVADTVSLLRALGVADVWPLTELSGPAGVRGTVEAWLSSTEQSRESVISATLAAAHHVAYGADTWRDEARWCVRIAEAFPSDPGIVIALLLNLVHLRPGQFLYTPAGQIHSYLDGTGIEIMANSDNVVRGGLTSKRVDAAELMAIADFDDRPSPAQDPVPVADERLYPAPVEDFRLSRFDTDADADTETDAVVLPAPSAQIVLCVDGELRLTAAGTSVVLPRGRAAFAPAGAEVSVSGAGSAFRATTNLAP